LKKGGLKKNDTDCFAKQKNYGLFTGGKGVE